MSIEPFFASTHRRSRLVRYAAACVVAGLCASGVSDGRGAVAGQINDNGVTAFLLTLEKVVRGGQSADFLALLDSRADREAATTFAMFEVVPGATRTIAQLRDELRITTPGREGLRIIVDVFTEFGDRGRVSTWQLDISPDLAGAWRIVDQERLSSVDNLYRLSINATRQYEARNFVLTSEDLRLTLSEGTVFTVDTDQGTTGLVLLGRGDMRFAPTPDTEKGQVRIFSGDEVLSTPFDAAYIRLRDVSAHGDAAALHEQPTNERSLRRAQEVFKEEASKTFIIELGDLSSDTWSLLPGFGDFVAEVRTRRFETLTYARARSEPEDVSVFNRRRQRNIAVYASAAKLAERGRFYNEDDTAAIDILHYDIDVSYSPDRLWLEGRARLRLRMRDELAGQLTLRLADPLTVHSVVSDRFGRLFSLRVRNQNTILINVPGASDAGELQLTITYSGRVQPQTPDREVLLVQRGSADTSNGSDRVDASMIRGEPAFLYSNRSYWYPQGTVSDYATARIRITVPTNMTAIASGELSDDSPALVASEDGAATRRAYLFEATRPVRYLAFIVSRFGRSDRVTIAFDESSAADAGIPAAIPLSGDVNETMDLTVEAHPLQVRRGRQLVERAADIARFYQGVVGDSPYPTFTLALVENMLPGGHSPGYFAVLNQPLPNTPLVWRTDPANFDGFPDFFLAHEMAHQWWGQAVGWRNYHEQWLSEGFAQYFAALYARRAHGDEVFGDILEQMRRWALRESDQGPVYLGYRLGHVRNDSRIFRALIYNKGAAVLHMLRGLIGDEAFFRGLRRFYVGARFVKAGTEDLRFAMEAESGQDLERFFERWIYGASLPRLTLTHRVDSSGPQPAVLLKIEQRGEVFDLPVVVTLDYGGGREDDVLVKVTRQVVEQRVPLEAPLRGVRVHDARGTLADIEM